RRGCWIPPPPAIRWARCWGSAVSPPRRSMPRSTGWAASSRLSKPSWPAATSGMARCCSTMSPRPISKDVAANWRNMATAGITALRAPAIKQLAAEGGPLQPSLFDDRDMAEITSPDYPGERLVVCKNPLLAEERARKRAELLAATEKELARIAARVQRARTPLRGAAAIGQAIGA